MSPPETSTRASPEEEAGGRRPETAARGLTGRRPYRRPRLKAYGRLTELTRFGGSIVGDTAGGLGPEL